MPKALEAKLKKEYSAKGLSGEKLDHAVYGTMNKIGAMHGNKETEKGKKIDKKIHIHGGSEHDVVLMGEPFDIREIAPGIGGGCVYGQDWEPNKLKESPVFGLEPETHEEDLVEYGRVYQPGQREQE